MNRIYITVDDCGLSRSVNSAVTDLAANGCISATGLLVWRQASEEAAVSLRSPDCRRLQVGLHLDLGSLTGPEGTDGRLASLIAACYSGRLRPQVAKALVSAQLQRFEDLMDRAPAFIDGHQHVHQLPVVRQVLVQEIMRRYGPRPPWLRITAPPVERRIPRGKQDVIFALGGRALRALAARHKLPMSRRLLGVYDFTGTADDYSRRLQGWMAHDRPGDVLMCHPAVGPTEGDPHSDARRIEYAVLSATVAGRALLMVR